MLTSPELELLWTWPGECCFEADGLPGLPPACLSCVPSEGSSSICYFPAWCLHNVIIWSCLLQCLVFHCSVFILLPRAHFLLFCFVLFSLLQKSGVHNDSISSLGCIWRILSIFRILSCVYAPGSKPLSLRKEGANPPFASCPAEPLAQGCVVLNNH